MSYFHKTRTNNSEIYIELQKTLIAKAILRMKNNVGVTVLPCILKYTTKQL